MAGAIRASPCYAWTALTLHATTEKTAADADLRRHYHRPSALSTTALVNRAKLIVDSRQGAQRPRQPEDRAPIKTTARYFAIISDGRMARLVG